MCHGRYIIDTTKRYEQRVFADHPREWGGNRYVYPVISRRSGGLSIGVNLNPDAVCNFACVYCQVDRSQPPRVRDVDTGVLERELDQMLGWAVDGSIFTHPHFAGVPETLHRINDIAFSGDGEPTTCPVFPESVNVAARLKAKWGLPQVKLVLITNACYLTRPAVAAALDVLMANNGEIWAKLDAGTDDRLRKVNRSSFPLKHIVDGIAATAARYPIVVQSLWMRLHDAPPDASEVEAFIDRLNEIRDRGGTVSLVQLYGVARRPSEPFVTPLSSQELGDIAALVRDRTGLNVVTY
ncbi:MAG: radical SAM protein [Phycisphaerae bacterium]|nr:radical SAM protein [Phycisphaerae bacterium]